MCTIKNKRKPDTMPKILTYFRKSNKLFTKLLGFVEHFMFKPVLTVSKR